jgi:hypothetical protein
MKTTHVLTASMLRAILSAFKSEIVAALVDNNDAMSIWHLESPVSAGFTLPPGYQMSDFRSSK